MHLEAANRTVQQVLAVPHDALSELYARPYFYDDAATVSTTIQTIHRNSVWVERDKAEEDDSLAQIIACAVVRCGNELLCIRRSSKSGRKNLRLRHTMMIGGHVDNSDCDADLPLESCVRRELSEELGIEVLNKLPLLGIAVDPLSHSGWLHLGIVFELPIRANSVELYPSLDTEEFTGNGRRRFVPMMKPNEILEIHDKLDPWSKLFAESNAYNRLGDTRRPMGERHQLFFRFISGVRGA